MEHVNLVDAHCRSQIQCSIVETTPAMQFPTALCEVDHLSILSQRTPAQVSQHIELS